MDESPLSNALAQVVAQPLLRTTNRVPLKKSVETLAIVPTKDKISIMARKIYNVMMHHAQDQGLDKSLYRVRLRDVISGLDFNSNNTELIKEHLRQMVTTKVEWQSPTTGEGAKWAVSALIAHAELVIEFNEVFMEWSYAVNIKNEILDPQRYARISLAYQAEFRSLPGLVLYEICSRYADNPGGLTSRQPWQWWRPVLTGSPDDQVKTYTEWKFFDRDVIQKAIAEINQITDLEVALIKHQGRGRSIGDIQFSVKRKQGAKFKRSNPLTPVDLKDVGRAISLGVSQSKAEEFLQRFGPSRFERGVTALEARASRSGMEPINDPVKYLKTVLTSMSEEESAIHPIEVPTLEQRTTVSSERIALLERFRSAKRSSAEALFRESIDEEQRLLMSRFETDVLPKKGVAVVETYRKRGLNIGMTKTHFTHFLAEHFFGPKWDIPSDTDLLNFSIVDR